MAVASTIDFDFQIALKKPLGDVTYSLDCHWFERVSVGRNAIQEPSMESSDRDLAFYCIHVLMSVCRDQLKCEILVIFVSQVANQTIKNGRAHPLSVIWISGFTGSPETLTVTPKS